MLLQLQHLLFLLILSYIPLHVLGSPHESSVKQPRKEPSTKTLSKAKPKLSLRNSALRNSPSSQNGDVSANQESNNLISPLTPQKIDDLVNQGIPNSTFIIPFVAASPIIVGALITVSMTLYTGARLKRAPIVISTDDTNGQRPNRFSIVDIWV
ncbi:hypothetical protein BKA69DRAFT_1075713 [Paraphysoderma sedebokerense]|nr:hypothetical protein BKA69DRAFT_1075713 [Paraphysoderma sedebokerense]